MAVRTKINVVEFRRAANDNIREIRPSELEIVEYERKEIEIWLLTEKQVRKVIGYYIKNDKNKASEFAYEASIIFDTKSKMRIAGAEESSKRLMVLAKTLFRFCGHSNKAIWAEQKLLGLKEEQMLKEAEEIEKQYFLNTMRKELHHREEVKEALRKFRVES